MELRCDRCGLLVISVGGLAYVLFCDGCWEAIRTGGNA